MIQLTMAAVNIGEINEEIEGVNINQRELPLGNATLNLTLLDTLYMQLNQGNWFTSDDWLLYDNVGYNLTFNETQLNDTIDDRIEESGGFGDIFVNESGDTMTGDLLMSGTEEVRFRDANQKIYSSGASTLDLSSLFLYLHFAVIGFDNPYATAIGITMQTTGTDGILSFYGGAGQDYFLSADDFMLSSAEFLFFKDKSVNMTSSTSGILDIEAEDINIESNVVVTKNAKFEDNINGTLTLLCVSTTNSASIENQYLKYVNGKQMTADKGCPMPSSGTITKVSADYYVSSATPDAEIRFDSRINGVVAMQIAHPAGDGTGEFTKFNSTTRENGYDFSAGDDLQGYVSENLQPGGAIDVDYPTIFIWGYLDE